MRLTTERLSLRELSPDDWRAVHMFESDAAAVRYQSYAPHTEAHTKSYLEKNAEATRECPRRVYDLAVVLRDTDLLIGRCGMGVHGPDCLEAALWYILRADYRGQGLMHEAASRLVSFAFDCTTVRRIWADTDPRNERSVRFLERLGFRKEAHFRRNVFIKGEWCDSLIYAVLKEEWA